MMIHVWKSAAMEALETGIPYPDEVILVWSWAVLDVILRDGPDMLDRF